MSASKRTGPVIAASIVWVSFLIGSVPSTLAAPGDIFNLGVLPSGTFSVGADVNNAGQVAGTSFMDSGADHAFLYTGTPGSGGAMYDLGSLGGNYSDGRAINAFGQVTGVSSPGMGIPAHAFIYTGTPGHGGAMADLDTLSGTNNQSFGFAINARGQVAGEAESDSGATHAFLFTGSPSGGKMIDLGTLGAAYSEGLGINDAGQVVGDSQPNGSIYNHAFLYTGTPGSGGAMHDLGILGGHSSRSLAVNNAGQVVGWSETKIPAAGGGYYEHAFLYTGTPGSGGAMHDLGTLPGASQSVASAINSGGVLVGSTSLGADRAFLYTGTPGVDGHMIDLNTWLATVDPTKAAKWTLTSAGGISDTGLITGSGTYDDGTGGVQRAFLLDASSIARAYAADFNDDGKVDFADLVILARHYGTTSGATWQMGDANGDGAVDFADLVLLAREYGPGVAPAAVSAVPEPACLAGLVLSALLLRRKAGGDFPVSILAPSGEADR